MISISATRSTSVLPCTYPFGKGTERPFLPSPQLPLADVTEISLQPLEHIVPYPRPTQLASSKPKPSPELLFHPF